MKKTFSALAIAAAAGVVMAAPATQVRAERKSAVYSVGEKIEFLVSGPVENVTYTVNDGRTTTAPEPLTGGKISVEAREPGFVLVTLDLGKDADGRVVYSYGGAAIEPEKIVPGVKRPADFEKFWQDELAKMRSNPLEVVSLAPLTPGQLRMPGFRGYDVRVRRGEIEVTGYMVIPADAKAKSLAAMINFNGASKVSAELPQARRYAGNFGVISFNVNFHGLANSYLNQRNRAFEKPQRELVARYQYKNGDDRHEYAMRKIFLRTVLVADYLATLPEYNGKLIAAGGSLGGCQALVCAALVPEVVLCVSNATAMCDHFGKSAGHLPGWPDLLARNPEAAKAAAYFDMVNFAPMVKCPTAMAVGFIDVVCPPATTYAAYNMLGTAQKKMSHSITSGHGAAYDKKEKSVFSFGYPLMRQVVSGAEIKL